jgi:hypothetical protein
LQMPNAARLWLFLKPSRQILARHNDPTFISLWVRRANASRAKDATSPQGRHSYKSDPIDLSERVSIGPSSIMAGRLNTWQRTGYQIVRPVLEC